MPFREIIAYETRNYSLWEAGGGGCSFSVWKLALNITNML